MITDAEIKTNTIDNLPAIETMGGCVGVQFIEISLTIIIGSLILLHLPEEMTPL